MIGILLASTFGFVVTGPISDCQLLMRFLSMNHVDSAMLTEPIGQVDIQCSEQLASKLLSRFSDEFGVKYSPGWPAVEQKPAWVTFSLKATKGKKNSPWPDMAANSLFMKAYRKVSATEKGEFISCQYYIRPWITYALKRTETVEGTFVLRRYGNTIEIPFWPNE